MANPEHLKILNQRLEAWNKWREQNPDTEPDLQKADFDGAKLGAMPISSSENRIFDEINGVHLGNSDLSRASFIGAHLTSAVLT